MADETGSQNTPQGGTQPPSIDYGKIEDMIHKGTQQRESAILEGYFKQLGMSGEELQTAVQDFKTKRATQVKEKENSYPNFALTNAVLISIQSTPSTRRETPCP